MIKLFCCRPIASSWTKTPIRLQQPIKMSVVYLTTFKAPGVKLVIQGKNRLAWVEQWYMTTIYSQWKKKLCPLDFSQITILLATSGCTCLIGQEIGRCNLCFWRVAKQNRTWGRVEVDLCRLAQTESCFLNAWTSYTWT